MGEEARARRGDLEQLVEAAAEDVLAQQRVGAAALLDQALAGVEGARRVGAARAC